MSGEIPVSVPGLRTVIGVFMGTEIKKSAISVWLAVARDTLCSTGAAERASEVCSSPEQSLKERAQK